MNKNRTPQKGHRPRKVTNVEDTRETNPVFSSAVCPPRTSALPLKMRDIGTPSWQLCDDGTSSQRRAEGGSFWAYFLAHPRPFGGGEQGRRLGLDERAAGLAGTVFSVAAGPSGVIASSPRSERPMAPPSWCGSSILAPGRRCSFRGLVGG